MYHEYTDKMKQIQNSFLEFLEKEDNIEENYQNLTKLIKDQKIEDNQLELKSFLHLISKIAKNHYRNPNFFDKIKQILQIIKNSINNFFTNEEIFEFFEKSQHILLFLVEEKVFRIDESIFAKMLKNESLANFFKPELQSFSKEDKEKDQDIDLEEYNEKRKIGENDSYLCKIIREDSIEDFIIYVNKNDQFSLNSYIEKSVFETHSILNGQEVKLIDYAAFFGSVQIFKYLYLNGVALTKALWIYGIHGDNPEIIDILKENEITPEDSSYQKCMKEAIKCHHNGIANYILNNLLQEEEFYVDDKFFRNLTCYSFHYYNFSFFPKEPNHRFIFFYACYYDYLNIVQFLFQTKKIDVKEKIIYIYLFCSILFFFIDSNVFGNIQKRTI